MRNATNEPHVWEYVNGTYMQGYLPDEVTTGKMINVFGRPLDSPEYEKGYRNEWVFISNSGHTYTVYDRYDVYRVGAHERTNPKGFTNWLCAQLGINIPE